MPSKPNTVPRPPNSFFCFRSHLLSLMEQQDQAEGRSDTRLQTNFSEHAGREWRKLDAATRAEFERMAEERKEEHARMYPGYKYRPNRKTEVPGTSTASGGTARTRTRSTSTSKPRAGASSSTSKKTDAPTVSSMSRTLLALPSLDPNFTTFPLAASPAPYSPFASPPAPHASVPLAPGPGVSTQYVPVPVATFQRLVNTPQPPSRTVSPAMLHTPYLAYSSMRELEEAVAIAEGRTYAIPPALSRAEMGAGVHYVPVPVRNLNKPGRRGAIVGASGVVPLVAYPTMDALKAVAVVVEGPPSTFLDVACGSGSSATCADAYAIGHALRRPDAPAPYLDEETRWRVVYPGRERGDYTREGSPMLWEH